ncbi:MAG: leucine-rich repeat domain-containing protein [Saprospiraceae bacterium]
MIRILIICLLLIITGISRLFAQCDRKSDSLELVKLYNATNGPNWTNKWDLTKPMESWYAISLNADGCINTIYLYYNGLQGNLPDIQLPNLTRLNLSYNQLSGSIPDFSGMPRLYKMYLEGNQLTGQIPNFSNLPQLDNLYLFNNRLTGPIPNFTKLPNVTYIKLYNNLLTGIIPEFNNFLNLVFIELNNNLLTGISPKFSKLTNLRELYLGSNQLTDTILFLSELKSLENLDLSNNKLSGKIQSLPSNLKRLNLANNQLEGALPSFADQKYLVDINLGSNRFNGMIPDFNNIENLLTLNLSNNQLTGDLFEFSNSHPKLQVINFSRNQLTGTIPLYTKSPSLIDLNISNNNITGTLPDFNSTSLWDINVENNQLEGRLPNFDSLPYLRILKITSNNFYGRIPDFRLRSNFLRLYAADNKFTFGDFLPVNPNLQVFEVGAQKPFYYDTIISGIAGGELIIDLVIDDSITNNNYAWYKENKSWSPPVGNDIHSNILKFPNLQIGNVGRYFVRLTNPDAPQGLLQSKVIGVKVCNLSHDSSELVKLYNNLDGQNWINNENWLVPGKSISTWNGIQVGTEGCLQSIILDNNNLKGNLPELSLNSLDTLILSNNSISGTIPNLYIPFIRYFNLMNNNIEGEFPSELKSWTNLQGFNVQNNNLVGPVPPDLGDLCMLTELKINNNKIIGELPEKLTNLQNLEKGKVDFSNNKIDILKDKIIFFCPFGDRILANNPSFDRFQSICNIKCDNFNWEDLQDSSWLIQILSQLQCIDTSCTIVSSEVGFVNVRGLKFIYTKERCCKDSDCLDMTDVVTFYDCGGHIVEVASCTSGGGFCSTGGSISLDTFHILHYDPKWICGQKINIDTSVTDYNKQKLKPVLIKENLYKLNCFPNPVINDLICNLSEDKIDGFIVINSLSEQMNCKFSNNNGIVTLTLSDLLPGYYFLEIRAGKNRYLGRFVKR